MSLTVNIYNLVMASIDSSIFEKVNCSLFQ